MGMKGKSRHRILSLLLCMTLLCSTVGTSIFAEDVPTEQTEAEHSHEEHDHAAETVDLSQYDPADLGQEMLGIDSALLDTAAESEPGAGDPQDTDAQTDTDASVPGSQPQGDPGIEGPDMGEPTPTTTPEEEPAPTTTPEEEPAPTSTPGEQPVPTAAPEGSDSPTMGPEAEPTATPEENADKTRPEITVTPVEGRWGTSYGSIYYCDPPAVTVTDAGGNLSKVEAICDGKTVEGIVTDGYHGSVSLEDVRGVVTIHAEDTAGNEASVKIANRHSIGRLFRESYLANCTQPEHVYTYMICGICGVEYDHRTYNTGKQALGHEYDPDNAITPCGAEGVTVSPCKRCGETVDKHGKEYDMSAVSNHNWVEMRKEPTCDQQGFEYLECSNCHAKKDVVSLNQLGHVMSAWKMQEDCVCGQECYLERSCQREGCSYTERSAQKVKLEHSWGKLEVIQEATCTKEGYRGYRCVNCGEVRKADSDIYNTIPATGHIRADGSDCTKDSVCSVCGEAIKGNAGHSWGAYQKNAQGHWRVCTNKGCAQKTEVSPHSGEASCTSTWVCADCGYRMQGTGSHKLEQRSDATHHWKVCVNPGCTYQSDKSAHYFTGANKDDKDCSTPLICSGCGKVVQEAMTHNFSDTWKQVPSWHWKVCTNPGCQVRSEQGEHSYNAFTDCTVGRLCKTCGYPMYAASAGHNFDNAPLVGKEDGHYQKCQNFVCQQMRKVSDHRGGTATCVAEAVCDICHQSYGTKNAQNHVNTVRQNEKAATTEEDGYSGDMVCTECKQIVEQGHTIPKLSSTCQHSYVEQVDAEKSWEECTRCGAERNVRPHVLSYRSNGKEHWQQCVSCKYQTQPEQHTPDPSEMDTDCTTKLTCAVCDYVIEEAKEHSYNSAYATGPNGHWHVCTNAGCSQTSTVTAHVPKEDDGDCTTDVVCADCGYVITEKSESHLFNGNWESDENGHYQRCQNSGCKQEKRAEHVFSEDDGLCTTPLVCTICSWVKTQALSHNFGGEYIVSEAGHQQKCQNEGCTALTDVNAHTGGTASCRKLAACMVCGQEYGELDPQNHAGGTEIRDYKEPTTEAEGYSGDTWCLGCERIIQAGEILSKIPETHIHAFLPNSDGTHHWQECRCGERIEYEEHEFSGWSSDNTHHWRVCADCGTADRGDHTYTDGKCTVCGLLQPMHVHTYVWKNADDRHWQECSGCGEIVNDEPHTYEWKQNETSHWMACAACGKTINESAHTMQTVYDGTFHWLECSQEGCGYQGVKEAHVVEDDHNCATAVVCESCGAVVSEAKEHRWSTTYTFDGTGHWAECVNEGCRQKSSVEEHKLAGDQADCTKDVLCEVCGYVARSGESSHRFEGAPYIGNERVHWQVCQNGDCKVTSEPVVHTGGTATCKTPAICEICHQPYGGTNPLNHEGLREVRNIRQATTSQDGYTGDTVCTGCEKIIDGGQGRVIPALSQPCDHRRSASGIAAMIDDDTLFESRIDDLKSWQQCTVCAAVVDTQAHTYTAYQSNADGHWLVCAVCGHNTTETGVLPHRAQAYDQDCTTPVLCADCGYVMVAAEQHNFGGEYFYSEDGHWQICQNPDCGAAGAVTAHDTDDNGDCTSAVICKDCGHTLTAPMSAHNYSTVWVEGENGHYQACLNLGCKQKLVEPHQPVEDDHLCTTPVVCSVCSAVMTEGMQEHNYNGGEYFTSETGHWRKCQNEGCDHIGGEEPHEGTATCISRAVCSLCGISYGDVDPTNHTGEKEVVGYIAPTETSEGYSGNLVCGDCGAIAETGKVLDKLSSSHEHSFTIHVFDSTHHWLECSCGVRDESSYQAHTLGSWQYDETEHWNVCTGCDNTVREQHTFDDRGQCTVCGAYNHVHEGGTATCSDQAVCTICGASYGGTDPANHVGGTQLLGQKEATAEEEGYTGDTCCAGCGAVLARGEVIPKLEPGTEPETETEAETETETDSQAGTETPATETEKTTSASETAQAPKTGDETNWSIWLMLMLLSGCGLATAAVRRKRAAR